MNDEVPDICAGIVLTEELIQVVFCEKTPDQKNTTGSTNGNFILRPYMGRKYDQLIPKNILGERGLTLELAYKLAAMRICQIPDIERLQSIGIASFGPINSLSSETRTAEDTRVSDGFSPREDSNGNELPALYGTIRKNSTHKSMRGMEAYRLMRDTIDLCIEGSEELDDKLKKGIKITLQTDVTCGALSEAYLRIAQNPENHDYTKQTAYLERDKNTLVFISSNDGIGGSYVSNLTPAQNANHPEMGYVTAQLIKGDEKFGEWLAAGKSSTKNGQYPPFYIERMISIDSLKKRSGDVDSIEEITPKAWDMAADYVAQLCATITFILAPHKIILHGDFLHDRANDGNNIPKFVELVREKFKTWISTEDGRYVSYDEIEADNYIDASIDCISWPSSNDKSMQIGPIAHGALVLAAQNT